jgi:predicted protein tyrosine phosphatase
LPRAAAWSVNVSLNRGAENPLTMEILEWAELIFVMERTHKAKLSNEFKPQLKEKRIICLDIPDNYRFMDPGLIKILRAKVTPFLPVD